jgi:hypothetical protein
VSSKGSPHSRFTRAIERRNLLEAEASARELGGLSLADALSLLRVIAAKDPARFEPGRDRTTELLGAAVLRTPGRRRWRY